MISKDTVGFLHRCLCEVPPTAFIDDQRFEESELESFAADASDESLRWQRFFSLDPAHSDDEEDGYSLDREILAREWCESVRDKPWFSSVSDPTWRSDYVCVVTATSRGRGEVKFPLYFHGQDIENADPDPVVGVFPVWFIEPARGEDRDFVFGWFDVLENGFWDNLRSRLVEFQDPLSLEICKLDSAAISDNEEGVEDYIRLVAEKQEHSVIEHPETNENCLKAEDSLKLSDARFGVEIGDNSHLLVCDCDISDKNSLHVHRICDGEPMTVEGNDEAENLQSTSRSKISYYNDLVADHKNVEQFVKIISGVAIISLIQLAIELANILGFEITTAGTRGLVITSISIVVPAIGFLAIVYAIWPIIAHRLFSWSRLKSQPILSLHWIFG